MPRGWGRAATKERGWVERASSKRGNRMTGTRMTGTCPLAGIKTVSVPWQGLLEMKNYVLIA